MLQQELIRRDLTKRALKNHLAYTSLIYPELEGEALIEAEHIKVMCKAIDLVFTGRIKRLVVSVPPGYLKTRLFVQMFVSRGFAVNPRSRFIHATYSDKLVNDNSTAVRDVLSCPTYRREWNVELKVDANTKGLWRTTAGGYLLASASGGTITGFRAGTMQNKPGMEPARKLFSGALVLDDPLKPDDALSKVERDHVNKRWHTTFKSRLAHEDVPVILIMQRLHTDDMAGKMLTGYAGCKWHHLMLPVEINNAREYPMEFTHGIPIKYKLPDGPLWPLKHSQEQIDALKIDDYTYCSQYDQQPRSVGGVLFKDEWLREYDELPQLLYRKIYIDTAEKTKQRNDYSVLQCWGMGVNKRAYLIDQVRGKFERPDLFTAVVGFWNRHRRLQHELYSGPRLQYGTLRSNGIEDKSAGVGLIQDLRRKNIPVEAIQRSADKYTRARDVLVPFASGEVLLPRHAEWLRDYKLELLSFDGLDSGHDDQVDPTVDAVKEMCVDGAGRTMEDVLED